MAPIRVQLLEVFPLHEPDGARVCDPQQLRQTYRGQNQRERLRVRGLLRLTEPRSGSGVQSANSSGKSLPATREWGEERGEEWLRRGSAVFHLWLLTCSCEPSSNGGTDFPPGLGVRALPRRFPDG